MKRKSNTILLIVILSIISCIFSTNMLHKTYIYNETTTINITTWNYIFSEYQENTVLAMSKPNFKAVATTNSNLNTLSLKVIREHNRTYSVQRNSQYLNFTNHSRGETQTKNIDISNQDWCGDFFFLKGFVLSDTTEKDFIMTMLFNQSVIKLKAIKEKDEVLTINKEKYDTIKVRITLPDWRSMFWSSYFWLRKSDGILVKSEEHRGPPGTPLTTMELVGEN